jgi:stage V sporulation protein AC
VKVTDKEYQAMAKRHAPKSPLFKDCLLAFLSGGTLCAAAEVLILLAQNAGLDDKSARLCGSLALIALSVLLTGLNVYDNIAKHAGAGTLVPITGFANSIAATAIEFKSEGLVLGMAAKMFIIAGPVIVYGTVASVVYGLIYWITTLF